MNQPFDLQNFSLSPDSGALALEATLAQLLVPGNIMDAQLEGVCRRLQQRFDIYCSTSPSPLWHRGGIITTEARCQSEIYLPITEIQAAFRSLLLRSCRYHPFYPAAPLFSSPSWIDALERILPFSLELNPASIILRGARDERFRRELLYALFVPLRFGGSHNRYPGQKGFLGDWLSRHRGEKRLSLDAGCGTGEGVYEIAEMAAESGVDAEIHGCTIEPLELAAAAHGWFPGDCEREIEAEGLIAKLNCGSRIRFFRDDICNLSDRGDRYDVVICNGLLGGPLLHKKSALEAAVSKLGRVIKKEGMILAADRFHDGWHKIIPASMLENILKTHGFRVIAVPEGVGAIRTE
ncbi:MAG: class I SAM-dependent methyltransferase [Geobacteraceae bacterium]|nr:class I SAM-dependent methyltransferase [Geobacteraceae bacterium]